MRKSVQHLAAAALFLSITTAAPAFGYEKEIDSLSVTMADKIVSKGKKSVAVVDFTDLQGNVRELDRYLAEMFSVALAGKNKGFRVIDRNNLNSIIKEYKLSKTGIIDPETARKLGKVAGVDALVTGTLIPIGDNVQLMVKVLDSETADVIDSAKIDIARTQPINELLGKGIASEAATSASAGGEKQASSKNTAVTAQVVKDILFEVKECKTSGSTLTCYLSATNKGGDMDIQIYSRYGNSRRSRMFDSLSNEQNVSAIEFANKKSDNNYVTHMLVSGVKTRLDLTFEGIDERADKLALLEITCCEIASGNDFKVQLRDIPISR